MCAALPAIGCLFDHLNAINKCYCVATIQITTLSSVQNQIEHKKQKHTHENAKFIENYLWINVYLMCLDIFLFRLIVEMLDSSFVRCRRCDAMKKQKKNRTKMNSKETRTNFPLILWTDSSNGVWFDYFQQEKNNNNKNNSEIRAKWN